MRPLHRIPVVLGALLLGACSAPSEEEAAATDEAPIESVNQALGEKLEANETTLVKKIADAATAQLVQAHQASTDGVARRDAHPKAHGCVTGSFTVNADIPSDLAVGAFQAGKRYDTWIRYSNGSKDNDQENDARGMAIKLLGVDGPRLLAGEEASAQTQDILLSNHHTFFITNLTDYVKFMETLTEKGNPLSFFVSWNVFDLHLREAYLARNFTTQPISSPLTSRYWSATPSKLGRKAVKYSARPCAGADTSGAHSGDPHYLTAALKSGLASGGGGCFDFMIQRQTNARDMPVEDSTVTWNEQASPFVPVAKIIIPPQTFDSPEQKKYCENLSFTPWHGTEQHRPLGSLNRTRKVVYEATSAARHRLNGVRRVEPTDLVVR